MKNKTISIIILVVNLLSLPLFSQNNDDPEALGLPGDNLNLYAVLDIFQKSPTLEIFEKSINDKETKINNLDLNNDKLIDYIHVIDYKEGREHSIVLQVAINKIENQDIAVIEVRKDKNDKVQIQIIGDEVLYGKNYIVIPSNNKNVEGTPNPGYIDDEDEEYYCNDWPVIIHIYSPGYALYNSPWYWGYYPAYWTPWAPIFYYNYWGFHHHYYSNHYYRRIPNRRFSSNYAYYNTRKRTSQTVIESKRRGDYNATYEGRSYNRPVTPRIRREEPINRERKSTIRTPRTTTAPANNRKNDNMRRGSGGR